MTDLAGRGKCELGGHGGYPHTAVTLYWACSKCTQVSRENQREAGERHAENMKALSLYEAEYKAVHDAEMKRMGPYRYVPYAFLSCALAVFLVVWFT